MLHNSSKIILALQNEIRQLKKEMNRRTAYMFVREVQESFLRHNKDNFNYQTWIDEIRNRKKDIIQTAFDNHRKGEEQYCDYDTLAIYIVSNYMSISGRKQTARSLDKEMTIKTLEYMYNEVAVAKGRNYIFKA